MGKASKKKARRREGSGQSRADFERQRAAERNEREIAAADAAWAFVAKAMLGISDMARKMQDAEAEGVKAWWGDTRVVPAAIPDWEPESLGTYFFSDMYITRAASAPPLSAAVIPEVDALRKSPALAAGGIQVLVRAVVFDGVKASEPALDAIIETVTEVLKDELANDAPEDDLAEGLLMQLGGFTLFEAAATVIGKDTLTATLPVLKRHADAALTEIGMARPTGVQVAEALASAVMEDYLFDDPADAELLARLHRDDDHRGNALDALIADGLLEPEDAIRVGIAVLAELADTCRTNATSILEIP